MSDATTTPAVEVGMSVFYVADLCHARDRDGNGDHVFEYKHVKNGPMRNGSPSVMSGDIAIAGQVGEFQKRDRATHDIHTEGGHIIRPTKPMRAWRAVILAVKASGACDLRIKHPHGHIVEYIDVPYSVAGLGGALHTWHLPAEGA